jgi:hypothetical protein
MGTTRTFLVQRVEVSNVEEIFQLGLVSDGGWFSFRLEDRHYRSFFSEHPLLNGHADDAEGCKRLAQAGRPFDTTGTTPEVINKAALQYVSDRTCLQILSGIVIGMALSSNDGHPLTGGGVDRTSPPKDWRKRIAAEQAWVSQRWPEDNFKGGKPDGLTPERYEVGAAQAAGKPDRPARPGSAGSMWRRFLPVSVWPSILQAARWGALLWGHQHHERQRNR